MPSSSRQRSFLQVRLPVLPVLGSPGRRHLVAPGSLHPPLPSQGRAQEWVWAPTMAHCAWCQAPALSLTTKPTPRAGWGLTCHRGGDGPGEPGSSCPLLTCPYWKEHVSPVVHATWVWLLVCRENVLADSVLALQSLVCPVARLSCLKCKFDHHPTPRLMWSNLLARPRAPHAPGSRLHQALFT